MGPISKLDFKTKQAHEKALSHHISRATLAFSNVHTRYLDPDGSLDLAHDLISGGFVIENGMMRTGTASGLGLRLI